MNQSRSIFFSVFILLIMSSGCVKPEGYYYLIANLGKGSQEFLAVKNKKFEQYSQTLTIVRRFEHNIWCEGERDKFTKEGYTASCSFKNSVYEPAFRSEPIGKWYAIHFIGTLPPTLIIYEASPQLPDAMSLEQLKASLPKVLKFVSLDEAPAEVRYFSPTTEVKNGY